MARRRHRLPLTAAALLGYHIRHTSVRAACQSSVRSRGPTVAMTSPEREPLHWREVGLLAAFCAILFAFPILANRTLTTHETVHCLNVREMRDDGDLLIPHYGGRVWLERPPLPFWLTLPFLEVLGDSPAVYRLTSAFVATWCVLLVGWMASIWYGRTVGVLAGIILATLREFNGYATGPEADIFLCGVVTTAIALFVYLEFRCRPAQERWLIGRRPWAVLAFFVVLGLANVCKGLFFGDAFILLPVAAFLLVSDDRLSRIRRYVWLPGWLAFGVVGSAWAITAYVRHPDVVELWFSDYGGRLNTGYMREPFWYYFAQLPWMLFPWSVVAGLGLWLTWREALGRFPSGCGSEGTAKPQAAESIPARFLWCWALVPLLAFSVPNGKHHHYLLHAVAPWAVLAAVGTMRVWEYLCQQRWSLTLVMQRTVAVALIALLVGLCWWQRVQTRFFHDRYADDQRLIAQVRKTVPRGDRLLVLDDWGPLDASWSLFYLEGRARQLHNVTFLADRSLVEADEVFVLTRRHHAAPLSAYGTCERILESAASRGEPSPDYRLGLYRLRLDPRLPRVAGPVYISPMQATGRAAGPELPGPPRPRYSSTAGTGASDSGR